MQRNLIYLLYWTLQVLAFPFLLLYLALRIARNASYARRVTERFGFLPRTFRQTTPGAVWLHAVSVGEAITALALLRRLRAELPSTPLFVSCTTLAGRAMAEEKLRGIADGVFYAPIDYRFAVRRVLRTLQPALVIVMETEIWPNLYRETKRSGAGLLVVNGRISDKALPKYKRFAWFFRAALSCPDAILAQDETAAARYRALGAPDAVAAGNLKYDFDPATARLPRALAGFLEHSGASYVWVAASTMPPAFEGDVDEDDAVIEAFQSLRAEFPRLLLVLVPRRPERFDPAALKLESAGVPFLRRSQLREDDKPALPGVLLLDSIGELSALFGHATLVFMGGSLAHRGGHNVLEPAAHGAPVITGPHNENFAEIAESFRAGGGLAQITDAARLAETVAGLLRDAEFRAAVGERAKKLAALRRGATDHAARTAFTLLDEALPRPIPSLPARIAAAPARAAWRAGVAIDRSLRSVKWEAPGVCAVSVGNLAMGGTGKTPFTIALARALRAQGLQPAVLMRGYRRRDASQVLALAPGEQRPITQTGEEARLILDAGDAWVGIGADRMKAWWAVSRKARIDVVLLDDGFQHWPMRRDLDIVLIDALDPLRGGLFPRGRLREEFSALSRAGAVVITRAQPGRAYAGLRREIARHTAAPIFLARVEPLPVELPQGRAGAFCGLGNPESFRATLRALAADPVFFESFPDHHRYDAGEIRSLRARADFLLTTTKDLANIDPDVARECRVIAIPIEMRIEDLEELLALITRCLRAKAEPASR